MPARYDQALNEGDAMKLTIEGIRSRIAAWVTRSFGEPNLMSKRERALRVVEEAVELGQALNLTLAEVCKVVDRVYERPAGSVENEVAGTMLTLLSLTVPLGIDPIEVTTTELRRIENLAPSHFRAKHLAKVAAGTGEALHLDLAEDP